MGINEVIKTIKKSLVISIRLSYQSICNHPILIIFSIFLLFMYKYFPSLFSFLLSTSPVLICTTLLLGILLSFGQPNFPQIEERQEITNEIHTRNLQIKPNLPQIEKESPQIEPNQIQTAPIQNEPNITEREFEGVFFSEQGSTTSYSRPEEKDDKNHEKIDILERETTSEREIQDRETPERENTTIQTGESSLSSFVRAFSLNEISLEDQQIDLDSPQWQRIDGHDRSSDSESDGGESSSPDASMTDIIPLLEEIDPLLDRNTLTATPNPKTHSDDESHSSHDSLDENSIEDEEEEREAERERKGDESREPAFSWTADDQKNLMDLGYSELERNQRLENLMARRRSRKNIIFDRNLIDLETTSPHRTGTGTGTGTDDLSRFRVQVAPVSVPRSNPFDFDPDPSIPGSAPSVFNPRRNPFDFTPYEQPSESSIFPRESSFSPREFMNVSHQNMLFKKYDSFNYSSERRFSRMKPYFVPEFGMDGVGSSSRDSAFNADNLDAGLDSVIRDLDPLSKEEEREEESESDGSDDVNSVDVELDQSEFEANGERESPSSRAFEYLHSLDDEVPLQSPVPDLLSWDNEPDEVSLGGASSSSSHTREFEENYEKSPQFRTMDLHSIPEEEPTEDPKPDKTDNPNPLNPKPSDPDSDEDADRIFPEPMDESLLAELDQVGDFNVLGFHGTVSDAVRVSNGEDPELTVYNARRHVLLEASDSDEIDALFSSNRDLDSGILGASEVSGSSVPGFVEEASLVGGFLGESSDKGKQNLGIGNPESGILDINARSFDDIESALMRVTESDVVGLIDETKSGILIVKANSKAGLESVFKQVGEVLGKSEPGNEKSGFLKDLDSGMLVLDAKSIDDIDLALLNASENTGNGDSGLVDETDSGLLIMKAKSKEEIETIFKQVGEVLGKSDPGNGNTESGMMVLEAKSINDIDLALLNASENEERDAGIIDETDSGLLIMKAKSKEDIESIFRQVGEVLGKSDAGNGNTESGMMVLEAKSINDIDLALLNASENERNGDSGIIDETDSGLLIMKAKSKEDIESIFRQVGEVLGKSAAGNGNTESGMMVLEAKSINDIDLALLNASENEGNGDSGIIDETDSGLLIMKAKSKEDIESIFKQVGEVLGKSDAGNGNPDFVDDDSGILVLNAKSIEDIDSAMLQVSENTGSGESGIVDETDSGLLIMKAKSKEEIKSVFKQVSSVLGKSDPVNENHGFVEDSDSGILVLDAKTINDIDSAIMRISENTEGENTGLIDETDSGMLIMKAKSKEDIESVFKQVGQVLGKSNPGNENPAIVEDSEMLVLDASSINDIDSALFHISENSENEFDETDNGMLVLKAKSVAEIESVFKQVGDVLGKSNPVNESTRLEENSESGILVLDAKSIEDIDSAMLRVNENTEGENTGLVDETDSGMLIMKAKSKADIESVFKQVSEVLGKQDPGNENPGFAEDSDSGMLVLDAKSINDIDSALLHMSEDQENDFDETENGMLVLKAKSVSEIESVFKQVSEVLGKQNPGNENPGFLDDANSEMLVLDAKSINDIDSAIFHVSENTESGIEETDNGMLVMKAKSLEDMESVFKQVGEVLGENSNTEFGNTGFGEETESGMLFVKAKSIEDIDLAIKQASEIKEINGLNVEEI